MQMWLMQQKKNLKNDFGLAIRGGLLKFNNKEYDISDDYIVTKDAFEVKYSSLHCGNYSLNGNFK